MEASLLIAALPGAMLRVGSDEFLWRAADGSVSVALPGREAAALEACATFLTRDEHATAIAQRLGLAPGRATRVVDQLVELGVLVDVAKWLGAAEAPAPLLPEPLIVLRSYRRPDALQRLLDSLLADERRFGRTRRYLVIDDDVDPARGAAVADVVRGFARQTRSEVRLLGLPERPAAVEAFAAAIDGGPERDTLATMLDPRTAITPSGSRTWNFAVLAGAGGALSIIDDDCTFPLRVPPDARARIELRDGVVGQARFFDPPMRAEDLAPLDEDPFDHLRRVVGQPTRALIAPDRTDYASARGRSATELAHLSAGSRVIAAVPGVYGGMTFNSTAYLNIGERATLEDLWRPPFRLERLEGDDLYCGVMAPRISSVAVYTPLLIDARGALAFSSPLGRADDTLFLGLSAAIDPTARFAHMPVAIGHYPVENRGRMARSREPLLLERNGFVAQVVVDAAAALRCGSAEPRLAAIGAVCADLAAATDAALSEEVVRWRQNGMADLVAGVDRILAQAPGAPPAWRAHAQAIVASNRAALLRATPPDAEELKLTRASIDFVARAARIWPRLYALAATERPLERLLKPL